MKNSISLAFMPRIAVFSFCLLLPAASLKAIEKLPFPTEIFDVGGNKAFLIKARQPGEEKPWVWFAPVLQTIPGKRHTWYFGRLLDHGISVGGINLGEVRGAPGSTEKFTAFYNEMVRRGYSPKPLLLGQSRGGLMMLAWAMRHPEKVTAFAGIYPVCNLASWPLKISKERVLEDYGMSEAELLADMARYNPIDNLQGLLANGVPIFIIHGNADAKVPYEENGGVLKQRYQAGGGAITVKIVEGKGHEAAPPFFECEELAEFLERKIEK